MSGVRHKVRLCAACAAITLLAEPALAEPGRDCGEWFAAPNGGPPGTLGTVHDALLFDPDGLGPLPERLVIAGDFTAVAQVEAHFVAEYLDGTWRPLGALPGFGVAYALAIHDNQLFAAGWFSSTDGSVRSNILRWGGGAWQPILPGPVGAVFCMKSWGGRLYAAGDFTQVGLCACANIAAWDAGAWIPLPTPNGPVRALAEYDGRLAVAGDFQSVGGLASPLVALWDGTHWAALGAGPIDGGATSARALCTRVNSLLVGTAAPTGAFRGRVLEWNGSAWSPAAAPRIAPITALAISGPRLLLADESRVESWDGAALARFADANAVRRILELPDRTLIAGAFRSADSEPAWGVASGAPGNWNPLAPGTSGPISDLALDADRVIAVGSFTSIGGVRARFIAGWDGTGWHALGDAPPGWTQISRVAVYRNLIICAGGSGATPTRELALWDGAAWRELPTGFEPRAITAFCLHARELIVARGEDYRPGVGFGDVLAWDGGSWRALALDIPGPVVALQSVAGTLYAAGRFTSINDIGVHNIARWDGTAWSDIAGGFTGTVNLLSTLRGELVAIPNRLRVCAYRWHGGQWQTEVCDLSGYPGVARGFRERLFFGGAFHLAGNTLADGLAEWDGNGWRAYRDGLSRLGPPGTFPAVNATVRFGDELLIAGIFERVAGRVAVNFARLRSPLADVDDGSGAGRCDGGVTLDDLLYYLAIYDAGDAGADVCDALGTGDADGHVDAADLLCFLDAFTRGN